MTTTPPPQDSNRAAYILPKSAMTEGERRIVRAYLRTLNYTKVAEELDMTRQRVARCWKRWQYTIIDTI